MWRGCRAAAATAIATATADLRRRGGAGGRDGVGGVRGVGDAGRKHLQFKFGWLVAVTVTVIVTGDAAATAIAIALRTFRVQVVAPLDAEELEGRGRMQMMIRGWCSACNMGARCARDRFRLQSYTVRTVTGFPRAQRC